MIILPTSVVSQGRATGTVTLSAAAPAGNASVSLSSGNTDVARVPANVSVIAGQTAATFTIDTSTVGTSTPVTIFATYANVNRTAVVTVTPPTLEPRFTVLSIAKGADLCEISNGDGDLDCRFDATTSQGSIEQYFWTFKVKDVTLTKNTTSPETLIDSNCAFLKGGDKHDDTFDLQVSLQLRGRDGRTSSTLTKIVKVVHNSRCDY